MSNPQVGAVYQQIIADVVESSRVDFEEGGVDEHVLEELKLGWQQKLSQLQVAAFPWDPKQEPQPTIANPPTIPSNAGNYQMSTPPVSTQMQQSNNVPAPMPPTNNNVGPRIKQEPGLDNTQAGGMSQPPFQPPIIQGTTAQQRAAAHLQANYGPRAAASISAIQSGAPQQGQNSQPTMQQIQAHQQAMHQQQQQQMMQQQQRQGGMQQQQRPPMTAEQYKAAMAMHTQQRLQNQNSVNGAQNDGAGDDFEGPVAIIKRYNANGEQELGRMEVDGLIRDKIAAMGQAMEGGGLMLPLREASNAKKRQRKVKRSVSGLAPQHDGPGSDDDEDNKDHVKDEELDEDAINSDLDDPDDGLNDEEDDDEGMGHIMLCMYDKVQRVKNKWKCVMKDGVLTVNGKEYVFHKASGEYEW
ncbi:transcription initiation factor IIA large subunit [Hyphodiscus hymeniophilus]|uniref:Transcription initiation factor IIA large subunit n=1 Tax=Hyphodiscus hymeniophilus TaxID=353542 RepID=A0A9P7B086_9HELO|nr:transcription initiation factor IIA large subunit [Hyphodiscus hymeniophilus]